MIKNAFSFGHFVDPAGDHYGSVCAYFHTTDNHAFSMALLLFGNNLTSSFLNLCAVNSYFT